MKCKLSFQSPHLPTVFLILSVSRRFIFCGFSMFVSIVKYRVFLMCTKTYVLVRNTNIMYLDTLPIKSYVSYNISLYNIVNDGMFGYQTNSDKYGNATTRLYCNDDLSMPTKAYTQHMIV